jgi:predicted N-acetyltransferase YhbS
MPLAIRPARLADAPACGRICFEAFKDVAERAGLAPDFPSPEHAIGIARSLIESPSVYAVVAERDGGVVGSNFLDERDPIRGLGPISVDPEAQGRGAGRRLMEAVLERGRNCPGVRLLQDAHNPVSLSLYGSLGLDVREPVALVSGRPSSAPSGAVEVRKLRDFDLERCAELCRAVHGFDRLGALRDARPYGSLVAVRDGRVTGYASSLTVWPVGHGVAESEADMRALVLGAAARENGPLSFLAPTRSGDLFRWALKEGFRTVKAMNLMATGAYEEPRGEWFPSVLY